MPKICTLRARLCLSLLLLALPMGGILSCGDPASGPDEPAGAHVAVESASRAATTIGPEGGSLSTTSQTGIQYRLEIPAGALAGEVEIAITPVRSIGNLPYSAGMEGAVRLEPSGLVFLAPAELAIEAVANPTGAQRLIGFSYEGDAASIEPTVAGQVGGEIRLLVTHFSGAGAAVAEPNELDNSACGNVTAEQSLLWLVVNCAADREGFYNIMNGRLDTIEDEIASASVVDDLQAAIALYSEWVSLVEWTARASAYDASDAASVFADEIAALNGIVAARLVQGLNLARGQCDTTSLQWLSEFFEFRALATAIFAESGLPSELSAASNPEGLCASAAIETTVLVDPLPFNQDRSLDIDFAVSVNGTPIDAVFDVQVTDPDNSVQNPTGRTDSRGYYTTVVRRLIPEGALFQISGQLMLPLFAAGPLGGLAMVRVPITVEEQVFRGGDARITVAFPDRVEPEAETTLSVQVQRLSESGYLPIDGATVDFTVDGGSAAPNQAFTGAGGIATTTITASPEETNIVIDIAVSKDGESLGTKRAAAFVEEHEDGTVTLQLRQSELYVSGTPESAGDWVCTGDPESTDASTALGAATLTAASSHACTTSLGATQVDMAATQISDPGFASDGRSATISFDAEATGSGETSSLLLLDGSYVNSTMVVNFSVNGADIDFDIVAEYTGNFATMTLRLTGPQTTHLWTKQPNDGQSPTFAVAGTLPSGGYQLLLRIMGSYQVSHLGRSDGIFDGMATIRLNPQP